MRRSALATFAAGDAAGLGLANRPVGRVTATVSSAGLRALAAAGNGAWHRAALACFANLQFQFEDFRGAIATYEQYLSLYPSSDLAWIVALRLGQAHEEAGDWTRAEAAYARAASMAAPPLAAMLGWAHAASSGQS